MTLQCENISYIVYFRSMGLQLLKTNSVINMELLSYKSKIHSLVSFLCVSYNKQNICEEPSKSLN